MAETIEQLRAINHGFDPDRGNWVHRGLDLSKPTELAPGEAEAFREHYATQFGHSLDGLDWRSEEHTSELQSLMRISYAVFCLKKKKTNMNKTTYNTKLSHHTLKLSDTH